MKDNKTEEVTQQTAEAEQEQIEKKPVLTSKLKRKKVLLEFFDLLKGAAFPIVAMLIFSSLIIIFMDYTTELGIQILALVGGEAFVIAAMFIFGRSDGSEAYKTSISNKVKRSINNDNEKVVLGIGEYAPWKGFVIGLLSTLPFIIMQFVYCLCDADFVVFFLKYTSGWAVAPLNLIGSVPKGCYFLMIIFPVILLGLSYLYGKRWEAKRQEKIQRAEDAKRKGKKKHYYEENKYEDNKRINVNMDGVERKNKKK